MRVMPWFNQHNRLIQNPLAPKVHKSPAMKANPLFNQNYQFTQVLRRELQLSQQCQSLQKLLAVRARKSPAMRVKP